MSRGRNVVRVIFGVVVALVALLVGLVVIVSWPSSSSEPWRDPVVSRDGTRVTVTVQGGSCDHAEADSDETSDRVVISTRIVDNWFVLGCDDMGVDHDVTVELDDPLGDRELVDGHA
jgi:hypothetical protein